MIAKLGNFNIELLSGDVYAHFGERGFGSFNRLLSRFLYGNDRLKVPHQNIQ